MKSGHDRLLCRPQRQQRDARGDRLMDVQKVEFAVA
jgi:hypothetical protein